MQYEASKRKPGQINTDCLWPGAGMQWQCSEFVMGNWSASQSKSSFLCIRMRVICFQPSMWIHVPPGASVLFDAPWTSSTVIWKDQHTVSAWKNGMQEDFRLLSQAWFCNECRVASKKEPFAALRKQACYYKWYRHHSNELMKASCNIANSLTILNVADQII